MKAEESSCGFADERQGGWGDGGMSLGGREGEKGQDWSRGNELVAQAWRAGTVPCVPLRNIP